MKLKSLYFTLAVSLLPFVTAAAQDGSSERFAVKLGADIGLGQALSVNNSLPGMSSKTSGSDFGVDFGWTFWSRYQHALEANLGLNYGRISVKADLPGLEYSYAAPASADMDGVPYIRYYELDAMRQKLSIGRLNIPLYLKYSYRINDRFRVHALAGLKTSVNASSSISSSSGTVFSYGVYPEYDNLMIDASYMNEFGESVIDASVTSKPDVHSATFSLLGGIGAEVHIWGPISAEATFKYEGGLNNTFKRWMKAPEVFSSENSPVTYTVADGQTAKSLSHYMTHSKLSRLSLEISVVYHF